MNAVLEQDLPKTRGDCMPGGRFSARPCQFRCRYACDDGTCSLDIADAGGVDGPGLARIFGISKQRAKQLEVKALKKYGLGLKALEGQPRIKPTCEHCGCEFDRGHGRQRFCCLGCRTNAMRERERDQRAAKADPLCKGCKQTLVREHGKQLYHTACKPPRQSGKHQRKATP